MQADADVVIVGGGAAGIGAARRLAGSGLSTRLVEAGTHLGGRALTQEIAGLRLDLGCGWMHSAKHNAWVGIARACGMPLDENKAAWGRQHRELGFSAREQADAHEAFGEWMQRLRDAPPQSDRAADALPPDGVWNAYIRSIVGYISGAPLERLSIADYVAYDENSTDDNWRTRWGLGSLIAGGFPSGVSLSLGTPVEAIALDARGVTVRTRAGDIRARAAILTMSTAVLAGDGIKLPNEIDPWREAARCLPLGHNEKIFLEITGGGPFEPETHVIGNPRDARTGTYYIRPFAWPVIECYLGGDGAQALARDGLGTAFEFTLGQLVALFGSNIRACLRPLAASSWGRMNRIGGAYSYALPGHAQARRALAKNFEGRLFFAGEATHSQQFSTAHGAHDTGVRAASEAIEALGHSHP